MIDSTVTIPVEYLLIAGLCVWSILCLRCLKNTTYILILISISGCVSWIVFTAGADLIVSFFTGLIVLVTLTLIFFIIQEMLSRAENSLLG
jgi:hypothetical protein